MKSLDLIFGENGLIKSIKEDYSPRPSQIEAASHVYDDICNMKHLILEGPCGFGKTFSYLVPLMEFLHDNRSAQAVICTNGISLQEQLIYKDIPLVNNIFSKIYSSSLKSSILKGKRNFICPKKFEMMKLTTYFDKELKDLIAWGDKTKTGDFSELNFVPSADSLNLIAIVAEEECDNKNCPMFGQCYYQRHKEEAMKSNIIVTNYHLLFSDVKIGGDVLLPKYRTLILDEAHEMPNIFRDFFAERFSPRSFYSFRSKILNQMRENELLDAFFDKKEYDGESGKQYEYFVEFSNLIRIFEQMIDRVSGKFLINQTDNFGVICSGDETYNLEYAVPLIESCGIFSEILNKSMTRMNNYIDELQDTGGLSDSDVEALNKSFRIIDSCAAKISEFSNLLRTVIGQKQNTRQSVYYFERNQDESISLCSKSVDASEAIYHAFFEKRDVSCILTSATLSIGGNFEYIKRETGLSLVDNPPSGTNEVFLDFGAPATGSRIDEFIGESPFDLTAQQLWYLPEHSVPGNTKEFNDSLSKILPEITLACNGGMLCLATSNYNMRFMHSIIYNFCKSKGLKIRVLMQGQMPKQKLIEEFIRDKDSVLVATKSFFTGVDVPGDSLRCLVVDKLPFSSPNDPVEKARSKDKGAFMKYSVPEMIISLKQAVGRGVRTVEDKCVIAVLDGRMATARYKPQIFYSFPYDKTGTRNILDVENFFK